jgi:hypothetical protein
MHGISSGIITVECDSWVMQDVSKKFYNFTKLFCLLGRKSKLDLNKKLLIYKVVIKPIWTYGIQLWGTASTSKIEIMERFQSKVLRLITDAPWHVPNAVIRNDLHQRRNYSPQLQVQRWTKDASQPSSNLALESTCLPETKETPAIRSALQIHSKHNDYNRST